MSVSHDANSVINGTILFVRSRWSKWDATWCLVIWCHYHQHQHLVMPMASSTAPLHLFSQDNQHRHWCLYHMILVASKMTLLHFLGQDNWNKVQHDFLSCDTIDISIAITWYHWHWYWWNIMPLLSVSCDVGRTISSPIAFVRSRQSKWGAT